MIGIYISLTGPPGSGKTTQGKFLAEHYNIPHISTGNLLREEIERETVAGEIAKPYIDKGEFAPIDITSSVVRDRLLMHDSRRGFIIDGYPRRIDDVEYFDKILEEIGIGSYYYVGIHIDFKEVLHRLLTRGRPDDTGEIIRHRYKTYCRETVPVLEYYENNGKYLEVDGHGSKRDVAGKLIYTIDKAVEKSRLQPQDTY
jgi:adenylate kinase